MTSESPGKMPLSSMDVDEEKRKELKRCLGDAFPEVFTEDAINFDQLKRLLVGEWIDPGKLRFGLTWPGGGMHEDHPAAECGDAETCA